MTRLLFVLFFSCSLLFAYSQSLSSRDTMRGSDKMIRWIDGLSWSQILNKAKLEGKYIFVDCYTTWCGPCMQMDKSVYKNKSVGEYFNDNFVSVKFQMDTTAKDPDMIKKLYVDAQAISREYKIVAYPSFLFFSPQGELLYKDEGFKSENALISIAQAAIKPGVKYVSPYQEYDKLVSLYRNGVKDFAHMPYVIEISRKLYEKALVDSLVKDYNCYLDQLDRKALYNKKNILFILSNINSSNDKYFHLIYSNRKRVDKLAGVKGAANRAIVKVIKSEIIESYMKEFYRKYSFKEIRAGVDPDWKEVDSIIRKKYKSDISAIAVRDSKSEFYWFTQNRNKFVSAYMDRIKCKDLDLTKKDTYVMINAWAWNVFEICKNKDTLNYAIRWMEKVLSSKSFEKSNEYQPFDTYANLLYKLSLIYGVDRIAEALKWEEAALKNALDTYSTNSNNKLISLIESVIQKMKNGEPTWKVQKS